ncbi:MAG: TonB family protein [Cryomorphaceae bacterium]|nr:TonB family protein [Cryomorphaceae bacterium]
MKLIALLLVLFSAEFLSAQVVEECKKVETSFKDYDIAIPADETNLRDSVFTIVTSFPVYVGCLNAPNQNDCSAKEVIKFIASNTVYPEVARENEIQGTVYVNYKVLRDGHVTDVKVLRGVNPIIDDEAVRVVRMLKYERGGLLQDKLVITEMTLPVRFALK